MGFDPAVLVTGASGQVGRALMRTIPSATFLSRRELDIGNAGDVDSAIIGHSVVVHAAAMTNVDRCEREPEEAARVNSEGTANICRSSRSLGARVIYLSTDFVFDGTKGKEYDEEDRVGPINQYGRTKLAGERLVIGEPGSLVVRTSWVIGDGDNFARSMIHAAHAGKRLRVVNDQVGRPTSATDLAHALAFLLESGAEGLVHVAGDGMPCSRAQLASTVLEAAGLPDEVEEISTEEFLAGSSGVIAPRPRNSSLSLARARSMGVPLHDWRSSIRAWAEGVS